MTSSDSVEQGQTRPWTVELVDPGAGSRVSFVCAQGTTVADAAEANGVLLAVVCANAGCGACRMRVQAGVIGYRRPVSEKQRTGSGEVFELACAAIPRSDVVLEPVRGWRDVDATPLSRLTRAAYRS